MTVKIGDIKLNTHGTPMKIIEYNNNNDILVEFQDEYKYKKKVFANNFKRGTVINPYDKIISGVGYLGEGKYKSCIGDKDDLVYVKWRNMIHRCYEPKNYHNVGYDHCTVCEEWQNYQNFAKWHEDNFYTIPNYTGRMDLDKDILHKGNKVYSPDTCIFVPQEINLLFVNRHHYRGKYPIGVGKTKAGTKYTATCGYNHKVKNLGLYDTPEKAFLAFKTFKEQHIKDVADKYKQYIPEKLYKALYNWKVEITD